MRFIDPAPQLNHQVTYFHKTSDFEQMRNLMMKYQPEGTVEKVDDETCSFTLSYFHLPLSRVRALLKALDISDHTPVALTEAGVLIARPDDGYAKILFKELVNRAKHQLAEAHVAEEMNKDREKHRRLLNGLPIGTAAVIQSTTPDQDKGDDTTYALDA